MRKPSQSLDAKFINYNVYWACGIIGLSMIGMTEERLLAKTVMRFAMSRFELLASSIVAQLQAYPACSVFDGDGGLVTLWDEYCFDQQHGPADFLEPVWTATISPHVHDV